VVVIYLLLFYVTACNFV